MTTQKAVVCLMLVVMVLLALAVPVGAANTDVAFTYAGDGQKLVDWMNAEGITTQPVNGSLPSGYIKVTITTTGVMYQTYVVYVRKSYAYAGQALAEADRQYTLEGDFSMFHVKQQASTDAAIQLAYGTEGKSITLYLPQSYQWLKDSIAAWKPLNEYYHMSLTSSQFSILPLAQSIRRNIPYVENGRQKTVWIYVKPATQAVLNRLNTDSNAPYAATEPSAGQYQFVAVPYIDARGVSRYAWAWKRSTDIKASPEALRAVNDYFDYQPSASPYSLYQETASYKKVTVYYQTLDYTVDEDKLKDAFRPGTGKCYGQVCTALGQANLRFNNVDSDRAYALTCSTDYNCPIEVWGKTSTGICTSEPILTVYVKDNRSIDNQMVSRVFWYVDASKHNWDEYKVVTQMVELYADNMRLDQMTIGVSKGRLAIGNALVDDTDGWNNIFDALQGIVYGLSGVCALLCLIFLIINIIKFGASTGYPMERSRALRGLLWSGIGIAGCGSFAILFALAYSLL